MKPWDALAIMRRIRAGRVDVDADDVTWTPHTGAHPEVAIIYDASLSPEEEYRLVLHGGDLPDEILTVKARDVEDLVEFWEGRCSRSSGRLGRVEVRRVSPWSKVEHDNEETA